MVLCISDEREGERERERERERKRERERRGEPMDLKFKGDRFKSSKIASNCIKTAIISLLPSSSAAVLGSTERRDLLIRIHSIAHHPVKTAPLRNFVVSDVAQLCVLIRISLLDISIKRKCLERILALSHHKQFG
jgi:hypothetical protein